jgi:hypothetical protein
VSIEQELDFTEVMKDVQVEKNMLDLTVLGSMHLDNLKVFKQARLDMIAKRAALKKSIGIMDKRIEITLAAIKVLQTPA